MINKLRKKILSYWNDVKVQSMYDKNIVRSEVKLIKSRLKENSKILDAGCGEGESTLMYSKIKDVTIHAVDFSETRLNIARQRLHKKNVKLIKADFTGGYSLDNDYDYIISQRFLINIIDWNMQKKIMLDLMGMLKKGGRLLMLEGSVEGVNELNLFRSIYKLPAIGVKWHNLFFKDDELISFMSTNGYRLIETEGMGEYFLLTRGIRPFFEKKLNWDDHFNVFSNSEKLKELLNLNQRFSRLKLWVFEK